MIYLSLQNMMIKPGAFNGESDSTSLHFELNHGWTGLLVEPHPLQVVNIVHTLIDIDRDSDIGIEMYILLPLPDIAID